MDFIIESTLPPEAIFDNKPGEQPEYIGILQCIGGILVTLPLENAYACSAILRELADAPAGSRIILETTEMIPTLVAVDHIICTAFITAEEFERGLPEED